MAINGKVPGLEVTVRCKGQTLQEFKDTNCHNNESAVPSTTRYIECADDTKFGITIKADGSYNWGYRGHAVCACIRIDGQYAGGVILRKKHVDYYRESKWHFKGRYEFSNTTGLWTIRHFKFTPVKKTENFTREKLKNDIEIAKTLGTIQVDFYRVITLGTRPYNPTGKPKNRTIGAFKLANKALKGTAISHSTSYGSARATPRSRNVYDIQRLEEDNHLPILSIRLHYRSREALYGEYIIPRPTPSEPALEDPTPAERAFATLRRSSGLHVGGVRGLLV